MSIGLSAGEILNLESAYLTTADLDARENANIDVSYGGFIKYLLDKVLKREEILATYLPTSAVRAHVEGDVHIHKFPHSLWLPYCCGWSFERILRVGLRTPNVVSRPARHLDTAISQLVSFFCIAAQEWTGAQAVSAFDLYAAPFVRHDRCSYKEVKQTVQRMLFDLNYPTRLGFQSAFTNVTILLDTNRHFLGEDALVGGKVVGRLGDYVDEAQMVARAMFELLIEGDAAGQPFTFPIPTLTVTRDFDWSGRRWGDLVDLIFTALARRGSAYLLNGYATDVEALYSMCCRLTLNVERVVSFELKALREEVEEALRREKRVRGIWAIPAATGSIGVVTINLPRAALLSRGDWGRLENLLEERLSVAREVLRRLRRRYEANLRRGLMPITRTYLGHFGGHYSTIGLVGLPEAAANFLGDMRLWEDLNRESVQEAVSFMKRVVSHIRKRLEEFEAEDGCLYNVEEVPAESAGTRLALLDAARFRREAESGVALIPGGDPAPYYSNSIVPYYADVPIAQRAAWEGEVQGEFTGGVIMHLFLQESPDPNALKQLARRIVTETRVVYLSFTPTISVCRDCGWHAVGVFNVCPRCGGDRVDVWSRIVGYYRPIRTWNPGKLAEFRQRIQYRQVELT